MVTGILLLYIGLRFEFPTLYLVGCWAIIIVKAVYAAWNFCKGIYQAGRDNGKS